MPRKSRIDYPGAVHHIIVRGIERRRIFFDDYDREQFLKRFEKVLIKTATPCYAWVLMPNHVHLLVATGAKRLSSVMQSLLTSYAIYFNKRHQRVGYLYQNRYKSILCNRDEYFLELIRYIHLNPIRANILRDINELAQYAWSGHMALIKGDELTWQNIDAVLILFAKKKSDAIVKYNKFIADGLQNTSVIDFSGGGLIRSVGGIWEAVDELRSGQRIKADERILGDTEFVENVLDYVDENKSNIGRSHFLNQAELEMVITKTASLVGIKKNTIFLKTNNRRVTKARAIICRILVDNYGVKQSEIAKKLGLTRQAISQCLNRGRLLFEESMSYKNKN